MGNDTTIAVLGTGIMGGAIARRLLGAGFTVRVWNRTAERAAPLGEVGAELAPSPAAAAGDAGIVLTMLADGPAVEAALFGPGGAAAASAADAVLLQMSTIGAPATARLAALASRADRTLVDAPVLGTREPAEHGELVVLASGPSQAQARCAPLFDTIAKRVLWVGETGAGSRLKVVVNSWLIGLVGVLAETIALAQCSGVDPAGFLDAIEGGPVGAPYARLKGEAMTAARFPASFPLRLAHKDAHLVLDAAHACGLVLPMADAMNQQFGRAIQLGHGDDDMAAVYFAVSGDKAL